MQTTPEQRLLKLPHRQEQYCRLRAAGQDPEDAYLAAGFRKGPSYRSNARTLEAKAIIKARVASIAERGLDEQDFEDDQVRRLISAKVMGDLETIDTEWMLEQARVNLALARDAKDVRGANTALMLIIDLKKVLNLLPPKEKPAQGPTSNPREGDTPPTDSGVVNNARDADTRVAPEASRFDQFVEQMGGDVGDLNPPPIAGPDPAVGEGLGEGDLADGQSGQAA